MHSVIKCIHNFSDNGVYIIPRWRGPDAQLKEKHWWGWTIEGDALQMLNKVKERTRGRPIRRFAPQGRLPEA